MIEAVIERLRDALEAAPANEFRKPYGEFRQCTELVASYQACLPDGFGADQATHRRRRNLLDVLQHPLERIAFD